jgi:hypothetical protein
VIAPAGQANGLIADASQRRERSIHDVSTWLQP